MLSPILLALVFVLTVTLSCAIAVIGTLRRQRP